jgi:hypothetical protein
MPAKKSLSKAKAKVPAKKEQHYELLFPNPKGVTAIWFDQFSIEHTKSHLVVKVGSSVGDNVFAFALSKAELLQQSFNFGPYVEQLGAHVDDQEMKAANVKRLSSSQAGSSPIHSVRYIRAGRVNTDGELVLYTFSTLNLLQRDKTKTADQSDAVDAEPIAILHADLSAHYGLVLELLAHTAEAAV